MAKDDEPKKPDEPADGTGPMLDMSQAAVKKMIATARARGYITYDELNEVLPPDQVTSEQIEDVMAMLSEMGINVVDNDEAEDEDSRDDAPPIAEDGGSRELAMTSRRRRGARPHRRPGADVPARDGLGRAPLPRGRDRHRQAHRGRPQHDDRRPLREPADLPGDHHLARRAARRGDHAARRDRPRDHLLRPDGDRRGRERASPASSPRSPRRRRPSPARSRRPSARTDARPEPQPEPAPPAPPPPRDEEDDEDDESSPRRKRRRRRAPIPTRRRTTTRAACRSPRWRPR